MSSPVLLVPVVAPKNQSDSALVTTDPQRSAWLLTQPASPLSNGRLARARGASERDGVERRVGLDRVVIEMDIRQSGLDGSGLAGLANAELADGVIDFLSDRRRPDATEGDGRLREVVWGGVAR